MKPIHWMTACLMSVGALRRPRRIIPTASLRWSYRGRRATPCADRRRRHEPQLGQNIIIGRAQHRGTIGTHRVAKAAPDGYTILLMHVGQATRVSL